MSTMQRLRERVESGAPVAQLLDGAADETGYMEALEAERTIEAQGRIENLEELVRVAQEYDATAPEGGSLGEFLQQIALLADADAIRDDEGLVTLMTMHNAKGLEFPIVFMIGMEDGVFPHSRSLDENNVEEERRLAYVGLTRAMRDLTLTYARRRNASAARRRAERPLALPRRAPARADRPAGAACARASRAGPDRVVGRRRGRVRGGRRAAAQIFRVGDDVVHAKLGEGVVTGVEPGGIVVVRFAGEAADRKLMADYAPIRKR